MTYARPGAVPWQINDDETMSIADTVACTSDGADGANRE